jgi:hypothetical protein
MTLPPDGIKAERAQSFRAAAPHDSAQQHSKRRIVSLLDAMATTLTRQTAIADVAQESSAGAGLAAQAGNQGRETLMDPKTGRNRR